MYTARQNFSSNFLPKLNSGENKFTFMRVCDNFAAGEFGCQGFLLSLGAWLFP
jgi:hypothetical protein